MTDVRTTQAAVEQWVTATDVPAQVTQVVIEQWASVSSGSSLALATQVALEQWVSLAVPITARQNAVIVISG